jgi:glyoxylase-like metal-dependent hydrolase (beta-lactamase superfamily II)
MFVAALVALTLQTPAPARPRPVPPRYQAPPPAQLVARALEAMGGVDAVRAAPGYTQDYHQVTFALGQEETPASPPRATVAAGRLVSDERGRRLLTVETRTVAGAVIRQRRVTAAGIGMIENLNAGTQAPDQPGVVAGIQRSLRLAPAALLLAAHDAPAALTALPVKAWRGEMHDGVRYAGPADTVALYFDRGTGLLTLAEQISDDPILGDRHTTTSYTRWQDAAGGGGVRSPRQIDVEVNGRLQSHTVVTSVDVAAIPDSLFAIPDSIASRAQPAPPAPPAPTVTVTLVELAPGVWRAEGGTHHSLVVEQPGQLVVVEAPQTSARMRAVLDTLRGRFPGKAVGVVVNTHHHWDHAGGVRAALAAGIPVATHRRNAAFVRTIGLARKTVAPDALSRRPVAPVVRVVDDTMTVGSGDARVVIYRLPTVHCEGMLAAYVPAARLLFTSDVLSPAATLAQAGSAEVATLARVRGIAVERVAGGHGGVASWPDVERAAGN